jgi:hypothetical protein
MSVEQEESRTVKFNLMTGRNEALLLRWTQMYATDFAVLGGPLADANRSSMVATFKKGIGQHASDILV